MKRKRSKSADNNRYELMLPSKIILQGGSKIILQGGSKIILQGDDEIDMPTLVKSFNYLVKSFYSIYKDPTLGVIDPQEECESSSNNIKFSQENKNRIAKNKNRIAIIAPASKLAKIVISQRDVKIDQTKLKSWSNDIRKLHTKDGVSKARIKQAMKWYSKNIGGEYVPVIHSGRSFRSKFLALEAAMERDGVDVVVRRKEPRSRIRIGTQQEE